MVRFGTMLCRYVSIYYRLHLLGNSSVNCSCVNMFISSIDAYMKLPIISNICYSGTVLLAGGKVNTGFHLLRVLLTKELCVCVCIRALRAVL